VPIGAKISDGQSPVVAAEAFVDLAGPPGDGIALVATDGAFDTPVEQVSGIVPQPLAASLPAGGHVILVRVRDAAGNWGPATGTGFLVDRDGPLITGGPSGPIRVTRGDTIAFAVRAVDPGNGLEPGSAIGGVEGNAAAIAPGDGAVDGPAETAKVSIDTSGLAATGDTVTIQAHDVHGNVGPARSFAIIIRSPATLLRDDFESGTVRRWTSRGGRVRVAGRPGRRASRW
jgi:hypothetical protein